MGIDPGNQRESLSRHLDVLLDLAEGERSSYVDNLELTEPKLALELRGLLARQHDEEFPQFLDASPAALLELTESTPIGRHVGAYVIDAEVGRGGMGSVWRAHRAHRAHRADRRFEGNVAVKLVHAVWIGGAGERRFRGEGQMLAQLNHPNIARLIDAGMLDGTQPFLVLEYVEGEPVDAFCGNRELDVRARIELFLNVLSAVAHAHSHLIVHRDVKPSNIFVARDGTVKLLDFGITKLSSDDADLTKTGGARHVERRSHPPYRRC